MNGKVLSTGMEFYYVQGQVMVNLVKMMDPIVNFRERMSGYGNLCRNPIMLGG